MIAATAGTQAIFAGGIVLTGSSGTDSAEVDIYNTTTGTWLSSMLPLSDDPSTAVTVGTKAIFAGGFDSNGFSNLAEIYDSSTGL